MKSWFSFLAGGWCPSDNLVGRGGGGEGAS